VQNHQTTLDKNESPQLCEKCKQQQKITYIMKRI